jgi:hypothetical protein
MKYKDNEGGKKDGKKHRVWFGTLAENKSLEHLVLVLRKILKWV